MDHHAHLPWRNAHRPRRRVVEHPIDHLHLEKMIARTQRAALVGAAIQRPIAHIVRFGPFQTAVRFGVIDIALARPVRASSNPA